MTLGAIQRAFLDHVLERPSRIGEHVSDARGLAVYRHAYRATLRSTLRDTYQRTAKWLGDDAFDTAADAYVACHPATSWTLDAYGGYFPDHLAHGHAADPEAAELAWLEWSLRRAFSAADAVTIDLTDLGRIDWGTAGVAFVPGTAVRTVISDVPAIWHALQSDMAPDRVLLDRPSGLLVWRSGWEPRFRSADVAEAEAIAALLQGRTFVEACAVAAAGGADPARVGGWLATWVRDGMVAGDDTRAR